MATQDSKIYNFNTYLKMHYFSKLNVLNEACFMLKLDTVSKNICSTALLGFVPHHFKRKLVCLVVFILRHGNGEHFMHV